MRMSPRASACAICWMQGEVCEAKLDIINQAWGRLDPTDSGCCLFDNLANTFKPDR